MQKYVCIYTQKNANICVKLTQNICSEICKMSRIPHFAYFLHICTPHFADAVAVAVTLPVSQTVPAASRFGGTDLQCVLFSNP